MTTFFIFIDLLELMGGVMIALMVIRIHNRIVKEYRIDRQVVKIVKKEHRIAFTGIGFLVLSFILRVVYYFFFA